uniref:(+)-neomenthol dehydrogenase-like n=1 Tax=Erigeron canadensis TaxID=72917 RepID=UPI001CB92B50|nr:(+)-neomenthol dehydrogenase-like [Erigeron canadensis]
MASQRIAVVTGGKKGIGFEIIKQLVSATRDVHVVMTAQDEQKGLQSLDKLKTLGLSENVLVRQLNVKCPDSIASFADFINTKFGKLDILVNNAGVNGIIINESSLNHNPSEVTTTGVKAFMTKQIMLQTYETAKDCIETNYYGTKHVTQALLPFLHSSPSPRIVNLTTGVSKIENIKDDKAREMLSDVDRLSEEVLDEVVNGFLCDAKDGLLEKKGWDEPFSAYILSKTATNAYTRVLAKKYPSFRINSVNPGFTKTDMTHYQGIYTPEEAARGPVKLALIPNDGPSGRFFFQTEETNF